MRVEKVMDGWTVTNSVEQHFRVAGRIIGKIHKPFRENAWSALVYERVARRRERIYVGCRIDPLRARALVESALRNIGLLPVSEGGESHAG